VFVFCSHEERFFIPPITIDTVVPMTWEITAESYSLYVPSLWYLLCLYRNWTECDVGAIHWKAGSHSSGQKFQSSYVYDKKDEMNKACGMHRGFERKTWREKTAYKTWTKKEG
jgi:hypothetical protein